MRDVDRELDELPGGGVYALVLHVRRAARVRVGALGAVPFRRGYYCYVGSARRGLPSRLRRHLRRHGKRRHWHVDYLRDVAEPAACLVWAGDGADECALSDRVGRLADDSVRGFGSSDCRCASQLHYFRRAPRGALQRLGIARAAWVRLGPAVREKGRTVRSVPACSSSPRRRA